MNEVEHIEQWRGQRVIDQSGAELGKVDEIFFDVTEGSAVLIEVKSGILGRHSTRIPLEGATFGRDYVRVAYAQETVDGAPSGSDADPSDPAALTQLGQAYGMSFPDGLSLESADRREARSAEAEAARQRAAALAAQAQAKLAERDAAGERALEARAEAERAQAEAERARQAALEAREHAKRFEQP